MLIEVSKNEETGKYEVETNVVAPASKMNIFDSVTAFYIGSNEYDESNDNFHDYFLAVNEDGSIVDSIDNIPKAKYLIPFGHGGSSDTVYVNGDGEFPNNHLQLTSSSYDIAFNSNQPNFNVTEGKINLGGSDRFIVGFKNKLHLNQIMVSMGS
jgi:hypothetical protein